MNEIERKKVIVYTDGACSGNPGPGGWGVVLIYGRLRKEMSGFEPNTTNNRMELMAAVKGLQALKYSCDVELCSDSAYLINAWEKKWLEKWQRNGWQTSKKEPVENQELWQELLKQDKIHKIKWIKVKGHSDNKENNRCDELARNAIKQNTK
jgi:ribonuclease HI